MKKLFIMAAVLIFVLALAGCNVAPNVPRVTPYVTGGTQVSPYGNNLNRGYYGNNTRGNYGNNVGRGTYGNNVDRNYYGYGQNRGMLGNNVNGGTGGTFGTGGTGGTTGSYGGKTGTFGTGTNANGSKGAMTATGKMNHLMNARSYFNINPGDKEAFPGAR